MNYQKDWLISNYSSGKLWCLTLYSEDNVVWKLKEWVSFFGLSNPKMREMVDMGYNTMMKALIDESYESVVGMHEFTKGQLKSSEYFKNLVNDESWLEAKLSLDVEVDKEEFEKNVKMFFSKPEYSVSKKKEISSIKDLKSRR